MGLDRSNLLLLKKIARYSAIGFELVFSVIIGAGIGVYLDRLLGTKPWLTLIFFILGAVAGFIQLFRVIKRYEDQGK